MNRKSFHAEILAALSAAEPVFLPTPILIVGGGRWAQVIATVLSQMARGPLEVLFVSPRNHAKLRRWAERFECTAYVFRDIESALARKPKIAMVINSADRHFETALALINCGLPTFVEKPLCETVMEALKLVQMAEEKAVPLVVGHVFFFASHIANFSRLLHKGGLTHKIDIIWSDAAAEKRDGTTKQFDVATPIVTDVMPHIWTLLQMLEPDNSPLALEKLSIARGGAEVNLAVSAGETPCTVRLMRNSDSRRRIIQAVFDQGEATLDFSAEPGIIIGPDGIEKSADPNRSPTSGPLRLELAHFFRLASGSNIEHPFTAKRIVQAVEFSAIVLKAYLNEREHFLRHAVENGAGRGRDIPDEDIDYALRETVARELLASGQINSLYASEGMAAAVTALRAAMRGEGPGAWAASFIRKHPVLNRLALP